MSRRAAQSLNMDTPSVCSDFGRATAVRAAQPRNIWLPLNSVTPSGIDTRVRLRQPLNSPSANWMPPLPSPAAVTLVRAAQLAPA